MLITSCIVKVRPKQAEDVVELLRQIPKVTPYGLHRETHIVIVAEAHDALQIDRLNEYILEQIPGVLAIFPSHAEGEDRFAKT